MFYQLPRLSQDGGFSKGWAANFTNLFLFCLDFFQECFLCICIKYGWNKNSEEKHCQTG